MKALDLLNEQLVDELGKGIPERNSYRWTVIDNLKEAIVELEQLSSNSLQLNCEGCKWYEVRYHSATCNRCERHPSRKTRNIKDYWESK